MAEEMEYLEPSFDPSSITMPRLRNILMTHDIQYPASAKKSQLVDIFNTQLKPQARKLLAARDKVRRTSSGITDMPSSQESTVNGDDDGRSSMPPPAIPDTPRQRKSRKSARVSVESGIPESGLTTSAAGGRRSSSKHARQSDTETDSELPKQPAMRRPRKSEVIPQVKVEEPDDAPVRPPMRDSAFSDENPFQSGSSPLTAEAQRRRSAGTSSDRKKSSSARRKTEVASSETSRRKQQDGIIVPTSKTFEMPVSRIQGGKKSSVKEEPDDGVEAGEEFAPEEQLELVRERAANGGQEILPRRTKTPKKSRSVPTAPWIILTTLLTGYATWYRQEKLAIGYCGIGRLPNAISSVQIPEWASVLQPTCEPCPQHAICFEGLETRCESDFVLQPHPLSLGGLVPLPPTCEPDGEKVRRVKAVADRAVEELRERKAQSECGSLKDAKGKDAPPEIEEQELKHVVGKKRRRGMTEAEFEELWKGAIGEIIGREEVVSVSDGSTHNLATTSLARLPIRCALKRSARLTLARYRRALSLLTLLTSLLLYTRRRILHDRKAAARVPALVATTLDRLATQAALHARGDAQESWISVGQLRDDILRDEFSEKRREAMWTRVRGVVERNANVRASVREGRGGDVSRVWEWIGGLIGLEETGGGRRSLGKRVSFGVGGDGEGAGTPSGGGVTEGRETRELRKWDEGRPLY